MRSLLCSLFLAASLAKVYAIGPIADLPIVNANIAPDGFPRSYVTNSLALWVVTDLRLPFLQCCPCGRSIPRTTHHGTQGEPLCTLLWPFVELTLIRATPFRSMSLMD